jgi:hypothetical protein
MQRDEIQTRRPPLDLRPLLWHARLAPRQRRYPRSKHHDGDSPTAGRFRPTAELVSGRVAVMDVGFEVATCLALS